MTKAEDFIKRMITDPDAVREEHDSKLIAERGESWYWENLHFITNGWLAMCALDCFEPTKPATEPIH